jgi:hypothetical protein
MSDEQFDDPPEERFADLTALFDRFPLAYAGYRISHLVEHDRDISESGEIPFVTTPLFPLAIVGYIILVRSRYLLDSALGRASALPATPDHVFSMTSTRGYRSHTFLEVARAVQERGEDAVFLCSPAAAEKRDEWTAEGFRTVTHRELHAHVGVVSLLRAVFRSVTVTRELVRTADVQPGVGNRVLYYNFVLLEHVKRESVRPLTDGDPMVHTYSPMPYLIDAAGAERLFVYQHGIQQPIGGKIMAAPFFAPVTYLVWGEPWRANFRRYVHSAASIVPVGSPWYEYLASQAGEERDPTYDVLLVSDSHGLTDAVEPDFERMVRALVETCHETDRSLAVKLHPLEEPSWYEQRGWGEYVVEYDDIDDALLDARVAVVNTSTAFVESTVLDVPVVVSDLWDRGLSELAPVDKVRFTEGPDVVDAVTAALDDPDAFDAADSQPLVRLGGSTERILSVVDERAAELGDRTDADSGTDGGTDTDADASPDSASTREQ